jgi:hypothetical protein
MSKVEGGKGGKMGFEGGKMRWEWNREGERRQDI